MRFVDIDWEGLAGALQEILDRHGDEYVLDLRANAYGFGLAATSSVARELGFRHARVCPTQADRSALTPSRADAHPDWLSAAHARSAQRFIGTVVNTKKVDAGVSVSYGGHYTTHAPTTLALVTLGFADGLPRLNPVGGLMETGGQVLPIAGRIAMDQCVLDCGVHEVNTGDEVIAWGGVVTIEQWSQWSQRGVAALSSGISSRVTRRLGGDRG